jgi:hypothetical protein
LACAACAAIQLRKMASSGVMSNKAECPACKAWLSGVYDAIKGVRAACPSCGLPGNVIREVEAARKAQADADLTEKLEATLVRAGKAEAEAALLREHITAIKNAVADIPTPPDEEYRW